jgi:2,4-dienoyl-CoA reductase-like NADH-dependent reductase (Old Yellow Enzyme family)
MAQNPSGPENVLKQPLRLPNGAVLKNRLAKSAMSEVLATADHKPNARFDRLYGTWAQGGLGLAVTGNVMIDRKALGEPRNVVVEDERDLDALKSWAAAGTQDRTHLWMQLNHPGKQIPMFLSREPVAPSAIPLGPKLNKFFRTPRALEEREIEELIERFAVTAGVAKKAGFTGVQIHGAHGYLISQFLSPRHNQRDDSWGGSPENRRRFVLQVFRSIRREVGPEFPVGIKLNSADFQRGGFTEEESREVVMHLAEEGMDLIEISGGTYESPTMTGGGVKESTRRREAYFLEYAEAVRKQIATPLMVTGGFRTSAGMQAAVECGAVDVVGMARPLAVEPDLPHRILAGEDVQSLVKPRITTGFPLIDTVLMLDISWYEAQIARIAEGKPTQPDQGAWSASLSILIRNGFQAFQQRRA